MRILALVTDAFGGYGGIAKFNRDLLTALCAYPECEEVVAVPRLMPNPPEPMPDKLTYAIGGLGGKVRYITTVLKTVIKENKFDLIICGHINLLGIACLAKAKFNVPLILVIHGIDAWQPPKGRLNKYLVKHIDALISVSKFSAKKFRQWSQRPQEKEFILPNCVDLSRFTPGPKNKSLLDRYSLHDKVVLMTLGRLDSFERRKGFDEVIEVLPELRKEIPNIVYLIAGRGPDQHRLKKKAMELDVAKHVIFAGYICEEEKVGHYRLADAFVMPSQGEGFGIVLLEAMACGIPVVASKADGGFEAVREGKLGIVVGPSNETEIKAGIVAALKRPKGAVPLGLDYFSIENFSNRLISIIRAIPRPNGIVNKVA